MDPIKLLPENLPPLFYFETSELGKLCCFTLRVKDWERLHTKQSESLSDDEWVRAFISVSCNKEETLKDGQFKPDDSVLSDDEVAKLSQSELEDFAIKFADTAPFLEKYKDDEAQGQRAGESNAIYLRRIYNYHHSKLSKEIESSIAGSKSMSEALEQVKSLNIGTRATDILSENRLKNIEKLKSQENTIMKNWQPTTLPPSPLPPQPSPSQVTLQSDDDFLHREFTTPNIQNLPIKADVVAIIESRLDEARVAMEAGAYLSVIFLCGSVLEAVLLGAAQNDPACFNRAVAAPKAKDGKIKCFHKWRLSQFIDVACEIGLLKPDVKKFSHGLRDFRNYIHPYEQMRSGFSPDAHTAKVCFQVLRAALADIAGER